MKDKPNLLIFLSDQLRPFEISKFGSGIVDTPNIRSLAEDGAYFTNAVSNNPVCVPARACLITGQYSRTCAGSLDNDYATCYGWSEERQRMRDKTLAELLQENGYETINLGKWHSFTNPLKMGFDKLFTPDGPYWYGGQMYYTSNDPASGKWREGFTPDIMSEYADAYFSQKRDKPFFMLFSETLPHMPLYDTVAEKYRRMYTRDDVEIRANVPCVDGALPYDLWWFIIYTYHRSLKRCENGPLLYEPRKYPLPEGFDLKDLTALYYGAIRSVDDTLGRVIDSLKRNGLYDDTIIVFLSDHGDNLGSHGYFNKDRVEEEAIRIPLIYKGPGVIRDYAISAQSQTIDVMPTLLDMLGIDAAHAPAMDGRSMLSLLKGGQAHHDDKVYLETPHYEIAVRTPRYKCAMQLDRRTRTIVNRRYKFFDLANDPLEMRNLYETGELPGDARALEDSLIDWDRQTPWLKE